MSRVPGLGLFFPRCSLGCQEPEELVGKYRGRRGKAKNKVIKYGLLQSGLLVHWLSVGSGFRILWDALQEHVREHPAVFLLAPWSWESRHAIFWG